MFLLQHTPEEDITKLLLIPKKHMVILIPLVVLEMGMHRT